MLRSLTLSLCLAALPASAEITVFAAASLGGVLDEVAAEYTAGTGEAVAISYAGSSLLARQIEAGAPADVFVSANPDWMDVLEEAGLVAARTELLGNALVLVGPAGAPALEIADLPAELGDGRLAVALTEAVPAGIYGRAALTSLGLWDALSGRLAETDNVRAALALVATGAAPYGIVYATDAALEPRVAILDRFPPESHAPITYPAAALTQAGAPFLAWLRGEAAGARFAAAGFTLLPGE
ncbi:molybdate ABC transporter substrate-binding protein [Wenxinia saemankumensis]|uniref:Molybdate transport system substrate-binding protein n=1 Tax=Wenxinia saemankumensis TaxID=1447782 RepID=A0A1M6A411_9RHOB|nr:molybdate ABC transporter substrate-binding protein [Wenxinia saemankumensis]SHI30903.1 molybdate transport system substrate-binding protein [Wenxinia saemankumensis]